MAGKFPQHIVSDAVALFKSGLRIKEIARKLGIGANNLSKRLRANGINTTESRLRYRPPHNFVDLPVHELLELYRGGFSIKKLAERYQVSFNVIKDRLIKNGIKPRTRSESMQNRMALTSGDDRKKLVKAANNARRDPDRAKERGKQTAIARQMLIDSSTFGPGENEFAKFLQERNIDFIRKFAVEIYNVDFLIGGNIIVALS